MLVLKEQNVAAIIATNDPYEAELLCDSVLFIEQGKMIRQSSMASLRSTGGSVRDAILSALGAPSYSSADSIT
jgi:ABC-type multidrug transport system ATPase subunit